MIIINKRNLFFLISVWLLSTLLSAQNVTISTPQTQLLLSVPNGGTPEQLYYGSRTSDADIRSICETACRRNAYPVYGMGYPCETALSVRHADGNLTLQMAVIGVKETRLTKENATLTVIELKDKVYPFFVNICYKAWQDADVIETWTEIRHEEKKPVQLQQFASAYLPVRRGNVWLSHLSGAWANEGQLCQEALQPGMKVIKNTDGVRNSQSAHAEVMFSLDGKPQENTGRVIGAALCYSGNYKLRIDTQEDDWHHFLAGINEENSWYNLKKEEVFRTPALALTYSDEGMSGCSRKFHQWARLHKLANGNTPRKILLNSWEGVYFDINEQGMDQMMGDIAAMGGELFVMDDGWFGSRDTDLSGLGDWSVNLEKLPGGLEALVPRVQALGMKFGLWIEPEMVSENSRLYREHPDWALGVPGRPQARGRSQLVLDFSRREVRDSIYEAVRRVLDSADISYIKWDMNRSLSDVWSAALPANRQGEVYHRYVLGVYDILERLRQDYPNLLIESCSGGGGRFDAGMLYYTPQIWCSDNTDAIDRLRIQYGTSFCYPVSAIGAHVSASPNEQNGRVTSIETRGAAAMSGAFGYEMDLSRCTPEEREIIRRQTAFFKEHYDLIQRGDYYRLSDPFADPHTAWEQVSPDRREALVTLISGPTRAAAPFRRLRLKGLDPALRYTVNGQGAYPGDVLMEAGWPLPIPRGDYQSMQLYLSAL